MYTIGKIFIITSIFHKSLNIVVLFIFLQKITIFQLASFIQKYKNFKLKFMSWFKQLNVELL